MIESSESKEKVEISKTIILGILIIYFLIMIYSMIDGNNLISCIVRHALMLLLFYIYYKNEFGPGLIVSIILTIIFAGLLNGGSYEYKHTLWTVIDITSFALLLFAYLKFIARIKRKDN